MSMGARLSGRDSGSLLQSPIGSSPPASPLRKVKFLKLEGRDVFNLSPSGHR